MFIVSSNEFTHQLDDYSKTDMYPFHMPGHKRHYTNLDSLLPWQIDITEIDGFDDLNHPETTFLESEVKAAQLYGATKSYFLINGSTGGLLAGIQASCQFGDKVLVARNCHQSVFHGIELNRLNPIYMYPEMSKEFPVSGSISPDVVYNSLKQNPEISTVIITSPTYDGVVSDIKSISDICHQFDANLIVDEAHGAHLGFHNYFPYSAVTQGADIVVQSLHKTLPSLTQTAILHNCSDRISFNKLNHAISLFHSTSPSYILSSSMVDCINFLQSKKDSLFEKYYQQLKYFYETSLQFKNLTVIQPKDISSNKKFAYDFDPGKIIIDCSCTSLSGDELMTILREKYHLECEMSQLGYVLAMTSVMDTDDGFNRLLSALFEIDEKVKVISNIGSCFSDFTIVPENIIPIHDAVISKWEKVSIEKSIGRISAGYLYVYPPGIPLYVPGEKIDSSFLDMMNNNKFTMIEFKSSLDTENGFIGVLILD